MLKLSVFPDSSKPIELQDGKSKSSNTIVNRSAISKILLGSTPLTIGMKLTEKRTSCGEELVGSKDFWCPAGQSLTRFEPVESKELPRELVLKVPDLMDITFIGCPSIVAAPDVILGKVTLKQNDVPQTNVEITYLQDLVAKVGGHFTGDIGKVNGKVFVHGRSGTTGHLTIHEVLQRPEDYTNIFVSRSAFHVAAKGTFSTLYIISSEGSKATIRIKGTLIGTRPCIQSDEGHCLELIEAGMEVF